MTGPDDTLAAAQHRHWQHTYRDHPGRYGTAPSSANATTVLELGAGHGRDALLFARRGFTVHALDFSAAVLTQLRAAAAGLAVHTIEHDVRDPLPLPDADVDAVFAHTLLCLALSTAEISALTGEVRRVLRPGGIFVHTVRHTGDPHYGTGLAHGDDIYENGGFAVHFFSRELVDALAEGWRLVEVREFTEGDLPRRLWRITQTVPR
ncbi:class I SAM-dependent methyltransferase [Amycolatopsis pithecellobii]|uniref:Methyltransferase domain-containing protein n=1 Tax=Amycolatopsis pithecellobii TaxID=664692 RepID=A0A6N7Z0P0_9PSEU|nr:class I SAM-dependent methyltransferase [Amycolatopsis pithecellobii]MTD54893.1 methyltransferase domain-containing protein [Amycolatopsis pithecellobii]